MAKPVHQRVHDLGSPRLSSGLGGSPWANATAILDAAKAVAAKTKKPAAKAGRRA